MAVKPLRHAVLAVFILVLAGLGCLSGLIIFGPAYIESSIVPDLGRRMGLDHLSIDIRRVGFTGADISLLRVGPEDGPALVLGSVLIDYAPAELFSGRIKRMTINGAAVYCGYENKAFYLQGLDFQGLVSRFGQEEARTHQVDKPGQAAFPVGDFVIDNSVVVFSFNGKTHRLPFKARAKQDPASPHLIHGSLTLYPRGESATLSGRFNLKTNAVHATLDARAVEIARFADCMGPVPGLTLSGELDLSGALQFKLDAPSTLSASAQGMFRSRKTGFSGIWLAPSGSVSASLDWADGNIQGAVSLSPIVWDGLVPLEISETQVDFQWTPSAMRAAGSCRVSVRETPDKADPPPLEMEPVSMTWSLSGNPDAIDIQGSANKISVASGDVRAMFPKAGATARIRRTENGQMKAAGTLSLSKGSIRAAGGKLWLKQVEIAPTLGWPLDSAVDRQGRIFVDSIVWDGQNLGALEGTLGQTAEGFALSAEHWNLLLSGTGVWIKGDFPVFSPTRTESRIDVTAARPSSSPNLDLGRFSDAAKGILFNGDLSVNSHFRFGGPDGTAGVLAATLKNGFLKQDTRQMSLTGIDAKVTLPDLPKVNSAPAQQLTIQKAAFGQVVVNDTAMLFQLETGGSLLIENAQCRWADGRVSSHAARVIPGQSTYELVLYCDRLSLAKVLEQFGAVKADGEGSVNGRIPVRLANGKLSFDDGFLYSTPGDGGTIHVAGADVLTAGIPKGSMQFNQIDLAREALKHYHYDWARLRLNTEGEDLLMALHLNGKPMNTLPFLYKKEAGGFIRISSDQAGSRFQGIRLDVNFRLPLNRILHYKDLLP